MTQQVFSIRCSVWTNERCCLRILLWDLLQEPHNQDTYVSNATQKRCPLALKRRWWSKEEPRCLTFRPIRYYPRLWMAMPGLTGSSPCGRISSCSDYLQTQKSPLHGRRRTHSGIVCNEKAYGERYPEWDEIPKVVVSFTKLWTLTLTHWN